MSETKFERTSLSIICDSTNKDAKDAKDAKSAKEVEDVKLSRVQYVNPYGDVLLNLHEKGNNVENVVDDAGYRLFDVDQVPNDQFYALKQLQDPETGLTFLTNRSRIERKFRLNLMSSTRIAATETAQQPAIAAANPPVDLGASARRWLAVLDGSS